MTIENYIEKILTTATAEVIFYMEELKFIFKITDNTLPLNIYHQISMHIYILKKLKLKLLTCQKLFFEIFSHRASERVAHTTPRLSYLEY